MTCDDGYNQLLARLRMREDLAGALRLLEWDQETYMPAGAIESRACQIGTLSALLHEQETDPDFLDLVDNLATRLEQLPPAQAVDVRETKWRLDRERALDTELVRQRSMLHAEARAVWIVARRDDDFPALAPYLEQIVATEQQVAAAIDDTRDPYDVLLEPYEPGATTAQIESVFGELRRGLLPLVERLRNHRAARPRNSGALHGHFPLDAQRHFNRLMASRLGFDFHTGRVDEAVHPFSTHIGSDVRITTRYDEHDLRYALYATIHETGHALYDQGLDPGARGTPRGTSCSLGIHESQSRLWENLVGRCNAFWRYWLPQARNCFADLHAVSLDAVLQAVNEAHPSLIRTEADEVTYNLHIILRFELEHALVHGQLAVADLPEVWRDRMRHYLGVVPETDRDGVLQDVHWATGALGYFPTYALGNIYAAQLMQAAEAATGPLDAAFAAGEFRVLLDWLRAHIHRHGQCLRPAALIEAATGIPPTPEPLLRHLGRKVAFIESA